MQPVARRMGKSARVRAGKGHPGRTIRAAGIRSTVNMYGLNSCRLEEADKMAVNKPLRGWILFAGTMLLVIGGINLVEGTVALVNQKYVVLVANQLYLVDVTSWGWTMVISGLILAATGLGLLYNQTWARWTGVVVVSLHAVAQVVWLGAYPLWSLSMMALDTVVLYALTARWPSEADEEDLLIREDYEAPARRPDRPVTAPPTAQR
jgi:hypothetical protein